MDRSRLIIGVIGAWVFGLVYDFIQRTTGVELHVLLIAAIVSLVIGLYVGLYANETDSQRGEA